ncbi:MAG: phosphonopyruvate decarboxylase [Chitinophagaceae bacterium]
MIVPERLYHFLKEQGVNFFTGVPDSMLKHFLKYIQDNCSKEQHIITANEGLAVGLASGYHLQTGGVPLVYLQNSGLGNLINPLVSLADKEMYGIPMLLLIGWRGRPGVKDEPQHHKMGRITISLLDTLEVPYHIVDKEEENSFAQIGKAIQQAKNENRPVALIVPDNIFDKYEGKEEPDIYSLKREEVIKRIIGKLTGDEIVICTTGKIGREFYEQNLSAGERIRKYFLNTGAMGHASHIALGIKANSAAKVIVIDGDGALLMHLGTLPTMAWQANDNFIHVVINNGCHESVGGQPTTGFFADCCGIARASGYSSATSITNGTEFEQWLARGLLSKEMQFVEIRVSRHSRDDLGRPSGNPAGWKKELMDALTKNAP